MLRGISVKVGGCAATVIAGKLAICFVSRAGIMTELDIQLAFDQRKYLGLGFSEFRNRYTQDLASLSQEASTLRPVNYTPTQFTKINDHTLVCPAYDKHRDISEYCTWDDFFSVQCSIATEAVRDMLLHTESDGICIWISPTKDPGKPFASRLNLYLKYRDFTGQVVSQNYGITWHQTEEYCLKFANFIRVLSDSPKSSSFSNTVDLRQNPMFIPIHLEPSDNPWEQVSELFPLPENIWPDIISGQANERFEAALDVAETVVAQAFAQLAVLGSQSSVVEYIQAGAKTEVYMADHGFPIADMSDCDRTNSGLLSSGSSSSGVLYHSGNSEVVCQEIKCARCPWKPTTSQLAEISARKLTSCPDCGWTPGESTENHLPKIPEFIPGLEANRQEVHLPKPKTQLSVPPKNTNIKPLSWLEYYFMPWLAEASVSDQLL